jgi:endonuclease/exonuclease/phosphatase family metal-dependent hydrolase
MYSTPEDKSSLGFLCLNLHKSRVSLETILQTAKEYDILFIQEPPCYLVKKLPSPASPEGEEYLDTCHHPDWLTIYKHRNTATFVNKRLLDYYAIISNSPYFEKDPNVIHLGLMEQAQKENVLHFLNIYNDNSTNTLWEVIACLLEHPRFAVVAGDFNLHSVEWDPQTRQESQLAQGLLDATAKNGLQLLNDTGVPTWQHPNLS